MLNVNNKSEIGCILASFILNENNIEISGEKITSLLDYSGLKYEKFWPSIFTQLIQHYDLSELAGFKKGVQQSSSSVNSAENKKTDDLETKEKKKVDLLSSKESDGGDMGFGLFD
jgi:ribosomal protein L12E/L44/L45/RPP1/RPP2